MTPTPTRLPLENPPDLLQFVGAALFSSLLTGFKIEKRASLDLLSVAFFLYFPKRFLTLFVAYWLTNLSTLNLQDGVSP